METYVIELFANNLTNEVKDVLIEQDHVTDVWFESNPNKEHDSIMVEVQFTEEQDDDVEYIEEVFDNIERVYYSLKSVIDDYDSMSW